MDGSTDLQGKKALGDTILAASSKPQNAHVAHTRQIIAFTLWAVGFVLLLVASVIVRFHPAPWPVELQTTITLQYLQLWSALSTPIVLASIVDNVLPSAISLIAWFVVLSLIGVFVWRRGGSPIPWFVTASFISPGTAVADGLNWIIGFSVARPRPSSPLIHVYMHETVPSFPSGHVENDVVYYGFLLYLSFTKPVSEWRYRWVLIPFQLYAVLNILLIGYSRVYEGSHWLIDVLAGYLTGALLLVLLIFLYRWTLEMLTKRRARRLSVQPIQAQPA